MYTSIQEGASASVDEIATARFVIKNYLFLKFRAKRVSNWILLQFLRCITVQSSLIKTVSFCTNKLSDGIFLQKQLLPVTSSTTTLALSHARVEVNKT